MHDEGVSHVVQPLPRHRLFASPDCSVKLPAAKRVGPAPSAPGRASVPPPNTALCENVASVTGEKGLLFEYAKKDN